MAKTVRVQAVEDPGLEWMVTEKVASKLERRGKFRRVLGIVSAVVDVVAREEPEPQPDPEPEPTPEPEPATKPKPKRTYKRKDLVAEKDEG